MTTRSFLDRLYGACTGGAIELRALPSGARTWTTPGDWTALGPFITAQVRAGQNVALGIATRYDASGGTAANLRELPAVFVDLDRAPARARAQLASLPVEPTFVVGSGAHVHAYYLLKEPADLANPAERAQALSVLRRLAAHLDADRHAAEAARVLRLPGSVSFKYGKPRPVTVIDQTGTVLNLSELDDLLPGEVVVQGHPVLENRLRVGRRNDVLYGLIRSLRYRGLPPRVIIAALHTVNDTWCLPPLAGAELHTLLAHALSQRDRDDFLVRHSTDEVVHDVAPRASKSGSVPC
jgi:hypothetical protein